MLGGPPVDSAPPTDFINWHRCIGIWDGFFHWRIHGQPGHVPPKPRKGAILSFAPPSKSSQKASFFRKWIWVHPKNSGLNPWIFQFWGYPRLRPRPKFPPPLKNDGWIRQWLLHRAFTSVRGSSSVCLLSDILYLVLAKWKSNIELKSVNIVFIIPGIFFF